jgi:hypothetical protein
MALSFAPQGCWVASRHGPGQNVPLTQKATATLYQLGASLSGGYLTLRLAPASRDAAMADFKVAWDRGDLMTKN